MPQDGSMMTFGGHLEVFRKTVIRVAVVTLILACVIFAFKDFTFQILLGPSEWNFCTYEWLEKIMRTANPNFRLEKFSVELIATDISSQFLAHISTSLYLGMLCASPYILYELFKFVSPALLDTERKYSLRIIIIVYILFIMGVMMSYFVLFPISFRFLGTYSVAERVRSNITIDSYISTFVTLTLILGVIFQLPVIAYMLGRMGMVQSKNMIKYRSYAFLSICIVAAIVTPPDVMSLILVAVPMCLLYEVSIRVVKNVEKRKIFKSQS